MQVGNELGAGKPYKAKLEAMIALGCAFLMGFINVTWTMILNKKEQERNLLNNHFTSKNYSCSLKKDSIMVKSEYKKIKTKPLLLVLLNCRCNASEALKPLLLRVKLTEEACSDDEVSSRGRKGFSPHCGLPRL
ncbi:hypothetical protein SESBI_39715 [Sesbania bispinosa]|nr:hypothetical protein SESBI_39715 [Sesbania bispinosa]